MKILVFYFLFLLSVNTIAQNKPGTSFYGVNTADLSACPKSKNALSETDVINLITEMLGRYGVKNRYIILNCPQVDNCQATVFEGKPYILYNPVFLNPVKKLNFTTGNLPVSDKDWATLTILAHELGHHVNNHLTNPLPDATAWDIELEADETAGFIIYLMKGSLQQAQLAFSEIPEQGTYTHPGRQLRMNAVARGWNDARLKYPEATVQMNNTGLGAAEATAIADSLYNNEKYLDALPYYKISADQGNLRAQNKIGDLYYYGDGVKQDYLIAMQSFLKAANGGYAKSQNNIGIMYEKGYGVEQNYLIAMNWYRKAAEQGYSTAQNNLADMYENGKGVNQDYAEAVKWYKKSAEQGNPRGQNGLGIMYEKGYGVEKNYYEAVKWYKKSADQGLAGGQYDLGDMYEFGKGVDKDISEAVRLYRLAAKQGNKSAQERLKKLGYE